MSDFTFTITFSEEQCITLFNDHGYAWHTPVLTAPLKVTVHSNQDCDGPYGDYYLEPDEILCAVERICPQAGSPSTIACRVMFIGTLASVVAGAVMEDNMPFGIDLHSIAEDEWCEAQEARREHALEQGR